MALLFYAISWSTWMHMMCITSDPATLQGCIKSSVADKIAVTSTAITSLCGKPNGLYCRAPAVSFSSNY